MKYEKSGKESSENYCMYDKQLKNTSDDQYAYTVSKTAHLEANDRSSEKREGPSRTSEKN